MLLMRYQTLIICVIALSFVGCQRHQESKSWFSALTVPQAPEAPSKNLAQTIQGEYANDIAYKFLETALERESAFCILRDTNVYAFTLVGEYATAPQVNAYYCLLKQPDAEAVFRYLLQHANNPGKIYAFHALQSLSVDQNEELFSGLLEYEGTVPVHQCCLQHPEPALVSETLSWVPQSE